MKEVQAKEDFPFESLSKLVEKTMSGYPVTQAFTSAAQDGVNHGCQVGTTAA